MLDEIAQAILSSNVNLFFSEKSLGFYILPNSYRILARVKTIHNIAWNQFFIGIVCVHR